MNIKVIIPLIFSIILVSGISQSVFADSSHILPPSRSFISSDSSVPQSNTVTKIIPPKIHAALDNVIFDGGDPDFVEGDEMTKYTEANDFVLGQAKVVTDVHITTLEFGIWDGTATWFIYENNNGQPGSLIATGSATNLIKTSLGQDGFSYDFNLDNPVTLQPGTYWLGLHFAKDWSQFDSIFWVTGPTHGFNGQVDKTNQHIWLDVGMDHAFKLTGKDVTAVGGSGIPIDSTALLLAGVQSSALWMIPLLVIGGAGVGIASFKRSRIKQKNLIFIIILVAISSSASTAFAVGGTNIIFKTFDGITSHEIMRITSDQRVGIGTSTPIARLDVQSDTNLARFSSIGPNSASIVIDDLAGGKQSNIQFNDASLIKYQLGKQIDNTFFMFDAGLARDFLRESGGNVLLQPVGGNVGIGTNNPTAKLDVLGDVKTSGKLLCVGCINSTNFKPSIQVIDCTNIVAEALLIGCDLHGMDLHNKYLARMNLNGARLDAVDFSGSNLDSVNFIGASLRNANLHNAFLGAADLSGARLYFANLSSTNFYFTNLNGAYLWGANLNNAYLYGANLSGADLSPKRFDGVDYPGANLLGANFTNTNLSGTNFNGTINQPTGTIACYGTPIHATFTCTG